MSNFLFCEIIPIVPTVSKVQIMCNPWLLKKLALKGTTSKNDYHIENGPNFN